MAANQLFLEGKIYKIEPTQQIKDSFKKREFIIETEENYPQKVKLEFTQANCDLLGNDNMPTYAQGERVRVYFNVRGSEWQGKFYVNLQAWKIERNGEGQAQAQPSYSQPQQQSTPTFSQPTVQANNNDADDLPF